MKETKASAVAHTIALLALGYVLWSGQLETWTCDPSGRCVALISDSGAYHYVSDHDTLAACQKRRDALILEQEKRNAKARSHAEQQGLDHHLEAFFSRIPECFVLGEDPGVGAR